MKIRSPGFKPDSCASSPEFFSLLTSLINLCEKSWEVFLPSDRAAEGLAANVLWFTEALLHKLLRKGRVSPGLVLLFLGR